MRRGAGVGWSALGHDEVANRSGGSEDAVIGGLMTAWTWHQCRQPLDEGEGVEGDGGGSVAPMPAQAIDDLAVRS